MSVRDILRPIYAQSIFVFIAFAAMVIASYFFMSNIERNHLLRNVDDAISNTQAKIEAELRGPETTLNVIAETIRDIILSDESFDALAKYMTSTTNYMLANERLILESTGVYGYFDAYGGRFHSSVGWVPPDDFVMQERPWYKAAIKANGRIAVTDPYVNLQLGVRTITCSRRIFDNNGNPLGIVCLDVMLDRIQEYVINTSVTEGSYGILGDSELNVIAHPHPSYVGVPIRRMNDGISIENELKQGKQINKRKTTDYKNTPSILFARRLDNGWYMAIIAYTKSYYRSVTNIGVMLSMLGLGMAIILDIVLFRMAAAKNKSDTQSRQKSSFLATMSHEIRTPMNAILGIAEAQMQNKSVPKDIHEALVKIYNSGYTLLGIINDILDFSKIEAGKLELVPVKYDVASLIHDTTQLNMMRIGSKLIKFRLEVDPTTPVELFGDELRLKQILNNLLSNAFKYTESGEVVFSVTAKYEDRTKEPHALLTFIVRDTGVGMTPDQLRKLFDEYSRFNVEANRVTEGTGLGMSITKHLVEMMKGSIHVDSEVGKGSKFTVCIPQGITTFGVIGADAVESLRQFRASNMSHVRTAQIVREPMPYGKVLIVDDVETNLYVAKGLLSPYDLTIDTAGSGFEALDLIKSGKLYDIIFMDHMMPKMDGIEATKALRGLGYTAPVVVLTANAVSGQAEMFLANGFDDFISKPIDIRQLNSVLNKLIRDKQSPEVIEAAQKNHRDKFAGEEPAAIDPELANIFIRDANKTIKVLETIYEKRAAFEDDDIQLYVINTHAIKSALANIGEAELAEFAQELEAAGREKNTTLISAETPDFLNKLQAVIKKVTPKKKADGGAADDDMEFLQEKLIVFRAACVVYDKKTAKEAIIELKKKNWSRPIKEMINTLTELLLHSEFEEAANIARDYDFNE